MMPPTQWSLVLAAGATPNARSRAALSVLVHRYQHPLYAFVRRRGLDAEAARDLVQAFFLRLLETGDLGAVTPARGKFRSWLLASVDHFLSNTRDRERAAKRGAGAPPLSLDTDEAERRHLQLPADGLDPEKAYLLGWVSALLEGVLSDLRARYADNGEAEVFDGLKGILAGDRVPPYAELAQRLGRTEAAIKKAAERLRDRYRDTLNLALADTLSSPGEVKDELRELLAALR